MMETLHCFPVELAEPIFCLDPQLRFTYASPQYHALIEWPGSLIGQNFASVRPSSDRSTAVAQFKAALNNPSRVVIEDFCVRSQRWLEYYAHGGAGGLTVLVLDVTNRRRAELDLRTREARWRDMLEGSGVAIAQISLDGRWLHVNARAREILHYPDSMLRQMKISDICSAADNLTDLDLFGQLIDGGRTGFVSERKVARFDGSSAWVRLNFSLVRDAFNQPLYFVAVFDNIDERKEAEESLVFALQSAQMGDWNFNATKNQTQRSPKFDEIFGLTVATEEWTYQDFVDHIYPEDRSAFEATFRAALASGRDYAHETRITWPDGSVRWILLSGRVYLNGEGRAVRMAGLVRDITAAKRAELDLQIAKLAAEDANREKSYFLANMSHEIRTPLGAVLGFTDALREPDLTVVERDRYLQILTRNGKNLSRLIDDILDLSKVEAGHMEVEQSRVTIIDMIEEVAALLKGKADAKGLGIEVRTKGPVPAHVMTDPTRLRQIVVNIVGNAIKFTTRGRVSICLEVNPVERRLIVGVRDTGLGIPADAVPRLFNPFTQADSSTTRTFGGTGLGLALSRRLARAMGGDVELKETTPGEGSLFQITIPLLPCEPESTAGNVRPTQVQFDELAGLHVLLAEDSPDNRELITHLLAKRGVNTEIAEDGRQAIDRALRDSFDLVLMDMQMPHVDGYEATRQLRRAGFAGPIVALTANAMRMDREKCIDAGCSDYVSKPIDPRDLFRVMGQALEHARH